MLNESEVGGVTLGALQRAMSQTTSPGAGRPYGLARMCRVLEFSRSTLYAQQARKTAKAVPPHPARQGPKTQDLGCRPPGSHSRRSGGLALRRRRPSQGLGAIARPLRHPHPGRGRRLGAGVLGGRSLRRLLRRHPCREDRQSFRRLAAH